MTILTPANVAPATAVGSRPPGVLGTDLVGLGWRYSAVDGAGISNGTDVAAMCRIVDRAAHDASGFYLLYRNQRGTGPVTYRCSGDLGNGSANVVQGVFQNGGTSITLAVGGWALAWVPLKVAQGDYFGHRTYVTVTSGDKWEWNTFRSDSTNLGGDAGSVGGGATDQTGSGTVALNTTLYSGPSSVLFAPGCRVPAAVLHGDSIGRGGTSTTVIGDYTSLAARGVVSMLNASVGGETLADLVATTPRTWSIYRLLAAVGNHRICQRGTNDVYVDVVSAATLKARILAAATWMLDGASGSEVKTWQYTIPPKTNPGNTAVSTNTAVRQAGNDWMRDGAPIDATTKAAVAVGTTSNVLRTRYIAWNGTAFIVTGAVDAGHPITGGIIEIADAVEVRATGLWISLTLAAGDGLHFSDAGHAATAAWVPVSLFT